MAEALFVPDGDGFRPTELCRGPWTPEAQHGGPPAALLARAVERFEGGESMQVARLTVELLRPVPLTTLVVTTAWARPGRRVQLVEARLHAGDVEVARATGLRIRRIDLPVPDAHSTPPAPVGPAHGVDGMPPWDKLLVVPAFHHDGVEHRFVGGGFDRPGPATDWIRLRVPLVAGEAPSPLVRVVAVADFGNGVSWELSRLDGWSFINPDLTVYLQRPAVGEWICLEAATSLGPCGVAMAESRLWDERGPIGRAVQSLLLDRAASPG
jgi:hypothetical protein